GAFFLFALLTLARSFDCFLCRCRGAFFGSTSCSTTAGLFGGLARAALVLAVRLFGVMGRFLLAAAFLRGMFFLCAVSGFWALEPAYDALPESILSRCCCAIGTRSRLGRCNAFDYGLGTRFDFVRAVWGQ